LDINACVQAVLNMRFMPLDWASVILVLIAATVPFLVVVASQIPLTQVL